MNLPLYTESDFFEPSNGNPSKAAESKEGKIFSIFYIEDNPSNLMLVEQSLTRYPNCRLNHASTGRKGIETILSQKPDLILLDMGLPDMEGMDVLRELKANPIVQNIPIVVLSANAIQSHIQQAKDLGVEHYLTKPIEIREFFSVLDQIIN